jgi:muramoyltetrapeptide carboxypeptidase
MRVVPEPLFPRALRPGDTVALVSPSSPLSDHPALERGLARLRAWGLQPELLPHAMAKLDFPKGGELAGSDDERLADLQRSFDDRRYRAVFCVRGGYGLTRLLPRLDFTSLRADPKPIAGYSDVTALLAAAHREIGLVSVHGPGVATPLSHDCGAPLWELQRTLLFESQRVPALPVALPPHVLRPGDAEGPLVGGNLSLVCALIGTRWQLDTKGKILFLEDVHEAPYRVDRMLTQLAQAGALAQASGIVFGDFHLDDTPLASEMPELLRVLIDRTRELTIPVAHGFPFGHRPASWTLPFGARARLRAGDVAVPAQLELMESAVR